MYIRILPIALLPFALFAQDSTIEDGGVSVQLNYWLTRTAPLLRGGKASPANRTLESPDFDFPGQTKYAAGAMISLPAGKQNSLRISYFRAQGHGDTTATVDQALFGTPFNNGDKFVTSYRIESARVSWDYLSYTYAASGLRIKTLWEAQYAAIRSRIDAPLNPISTDSSGVTTYNYGEGTKYVILPAFGLELEQAKGKHFRWEAKGSGFGLPKRSMMWNAEAAAVLRFERWEILAGGRAFQVKTSPKDDAYFKQTLYGPYVGVRWYLEKR
ncbi:MAG: hypothetical protein IT168_03885 [Bryobacterales bacterium]|nr:hypothetical protein [Bryobacterales bacterium]